MSAVHTITTNKACYLMRDRFDAVEVWRTLGLNVEACAAHMYDSGFMQNFRGALSTRIVPIVKDIGLWGQTIREGYTEMGIIGLADVDVRALQESDEDIAKSFDARREYVASVAARAKAMAPA